MLKYYVHGDVVDDIKKKREVSGDRVKAGSMTRQKPSKPCRGTAADGSVSNWRR